LRSRRRDSPVTGPLGKGLHSLQLLSRNDETDI
jgi:hypothetical protein